MGLDRKAVICPSGKIAGGTGDPAPPSWACPTLLAYHRVAPQVCNHHENFLARKHRLCYQGFAFSDHSTMMPQHFRSDRPSMSIRVDIANQVRQTTVLAWRPLLPLFEAVMNSFQAIKEANFPANIPGRITIEVKRGGGQLDLDVSPISGFRITDNGIGLDERN